MATNTVGSTGDYATLSAWEAAVQGTSDATEIAQLQSEDHANDAAADISGWTNTPDVTIGAVDAQDGDLSTGARFNRSSGGFIVVCSESDVPVVVEDVAMTITGGFYVGILTGTDGATYSNALRFGLSRCIVKSNDNFGCSAATLNARSTTISAGNRIGLDIDNCVFIDFTSSSYALELGYSGGGRQNMDVVVRGTTFYESHIRVGSNHGDSTTAVLARGCLWKTPGSSDALVDETGSGTYSFTSSRCILDESSATHTADWTTSTNNSYSVTFNDSGAPASGEVSFTDALNDDYSIVDNANNLAIDFVTSGSMPADDILGATRDSNPDAGAFEIVSAGNTIAVPTDAVTIASPTPTVVVTEDNLIAVPTDSVTIDSPTPTVITSADNVIEVPADTVTIDGPTPVVTVTENVLVEVPADTVTIGSPVPTIVVPNVIEVPADTVTIGSPVPLVSRDVVIEVPAPGTVTIAGPTPSIAGTIPTSFITVIVVDRNIEFEEGGEMVITLDGPSATDPKVRVIAQFLQDDPHP